MSDEPQSRRRPTSGRTPAAAATAVATLLTLAVGLPGPASAAPAAPPRPAAPAPPTPATRPAAKRSDRVVFLVCAAGGMLTNVADVADEVEKAVGDLRPGQTFAVHATASNRASALDKGWLPPGPANAAKAAEFVRGLAAGGGTDPVPALRAVAALRPDVVWLIAPDAGFDVQPLTAAAKAGGFRVNLSAKYVGQNDRQPFARAATACGGVCVDGDGEVVPDESAPPPANPPSSPSSPSSPPPPRGPKGKSAFREDGR